MDRDTSTVDCFLSDTEFDRLYSEEAQPEEDAFCTRHEDLPRELLFDALSYAHEIAVEANRVGQVIDIPVHVRQKTAEYLLSVELGVLGIRF